MSKIHVSAPKWKKKKKKKNSKSGVLYAQITHAALLKLSKKRRKHQHFIYLHILVQYSLLCKDFSDTHSYSNVLRANIKCRVLLKLGEKR
jgi:hypothetical protein